MELWHQLDRVPNAQMVGQFHDELNVDWVPGQVSLDRTVEIVEEAMSKTRLADFPLTAAVQHAHRYIK